MSLSELQTVLVQVFASGILVGALFASVIVFFGRR